jgi:Mg2+ and Co2+ transporter CorA
LRDLRLVDTSYPNQIRAAFMARPNVILITIENIKLVIQRNEVLVFNPLEKEVQQFVSLLNHQILQLSQNEKLESVEYERKKDEENLVDSHLSVAELSSDDYQAHFTDSILEFEKRNQFHLIVLEVALNSVLSKLHRTVHSLAPAVEIALKDLKAETKSFDIMQSKAGELLQLKNSLDELNNRVEEIKREILKILESDVDMSLMCLHIIDQHQQQQTLSPQSSQSSSSIPSSSSSPTASCSAPFNVSSRVSMSRSELTIIEFLFENYLRESEWILSEIDDLLDEITNTEENVKMQLDLLRNRILRLELSLSVTSVVITSGALITGLFGMNLINHLEHHPYMFPTITGVISLSMLSMYLSYRHYMKRRKL